MRCGESVFVELSHALNAMVDAVLDQVGKVSKAYRAEPLLALEPYRATGDAGGGCDGEYAV